MRLPAHGEAALALLYDLPLLLSSAVAQPLAALLPYGCGTPLAGAALPILQKCAVISVYRGTTQCGERSNAAFGTQSAAEQTSLAPHDSKARLLSGRDSQGFMAKPCTPHLHCAARAALQAANCQCRGARGPPLAFLWGIQRGYSLRKENTPFGVAARAPLSLPRLRGKRCSPFGLSFPPRGARKAPAPLRAQKKSTLTGALFQIAEN